MRLVSARTRQNFAIICCESIVRLVNTRATRMEQGSTHAIGAKGLRAIGIIVKNREIMALIPEKKKNTISTHPSLPIAKLGDAGAQSLNGFACGQRHQHEVIPVRLVFEKSQNPSPLWEKTPEHANMPEKAEG